VNCKGKKEKGIPHMRDPMLNIEYRSEERKMNVELQDSIFDVQYSRFKKRICNILAPKIILCFHSHKPFLTIPPL